jgi:hypothetical protein
MSIIRGEWPLGRPLTLLNAVTQNGSSTAYRMTKDKASFQITGTFTATITVEVSNDGVNFVSSGLSFTAAGVGAIDVAFVWIRVTVSGYSSGTITCTALV